MKAAKQFPLKTERKNCMNAIFVPPNAQHKEAKAWCLDHRQTPEELLTFCWNNQFNFVCAN